MYKSQSVPKPPVMYGPGKAYTKHKRHTLINAVCPQKNADGDVAPPAAQAPIFLSLSECSSFKWSSILIQLHLF